MDFLNIGGGELLVIVLLAIILFGPEDILKIMRTIGEYVRKIQQMWAQMSAGLSGEFITDEVIPEEIRETIKETQESVAALQKTFADIEATAKADLSQTKAMVEEVETSLKEIGTSVSDTVDEVPKALEATLNAPATKATPIVAPPSATVPDDREPSPEMLQAVTPVEDTGAAEADAVENEPRTVQASPPQPATVDAPEARADDEDI